MSRHVTTMTIYDVGHYTDEERKTIISGYPAHEREARANGIPTLGSGRIFPVDEESIKYDASKQEMPDHFAWIGGIDFGWDHPTAGVLVAWDRDADCVYITQAYKRKEATPLLHSAALKPWGDWFYWSWPHDGYQHDKGSGQALKAQYADNGLRMLEEHATHEDGGNGVEAGLMDMLDRMETGRFKVASHLVDWFEEFRLYHRENGKVVKEFDDLMAATRYALMSLRFAKPKTRKKRNSPPVADGWMG